ncbi:DUF551 domain-containing protein [Klebsiella pneumoniae]|nr:DUF551 domain-containing protein [Klebsiella pneumoniae]MCD0210383.1 DUF551 domain-containing protein [Klebsiella pneumoniae]
MTRKFSIDNRELLQRISSGEAVVGIDFGNLIVRELAAFRLAAMDSEPVGYFGRFDPDDEDLIDQCSKNVKGAFPLYRHAQPAPVVQCPFPCGWDNLNKLAIQDAALVARGLVEGELTTEAHRQAAISNNDRLLKVISACRSAMLAAAQQSPGSEPATVPGTWIPVSERMPEVGVKVLCFPAEDEPIHAVFNGQLWLQDVSWSASYEPIDNVIPITVTHWMPLPAAPQEVK